MRHDEDGLKLPPHSIEAEETLIGAVMLDNDTFDRVGDLIAPGDFYAARHATIWLAMSDMVEGGHRIDAVTLAAKLDGMNELERIGGIQALGQLAGAASTAVNARRYAEIVRERAILRRLIAAGSDIADAAFNPAGRTSIDLLAEAQQLVDGLTDGRSVDIPDFRSALTGFVEQLEERYRNGGKKGLPTTLDDLDELTGGLQAGDLVLIAGRPSMGKTMMGMQLAQSAAISGQPAIVFSLEMSRDAIVERMISSVGSIDNVTLRNGTLNTHDWERLSGALGQLTNAQLFVFDHADMTVARMRAAARKVSRKHGCALVVVDYLQLASADGDNRNEQISAISRGLKAMAKELKCPVVALSQLSREVERRPNKRPQLSDLRDSGALEQDADVVALMYRDDYYNEDSERKGVVELNVAKQRMGPTGIVYAQFDGAHSRIRPLERGWQPTPSTKKQSVRGMV